MSVGILDGFHEGVISFSNKVLKAMFDSESKALLMRPLALTSYIYFIVLYKQGTSYKLSLDHLDL